MLPAGRTRGLAENDHDLVIWTSCLPQTLVQLQRQRHTRSARGPLIMVAWFTSGNEIKQDTTAAATYSDSDEDVLDLDRTER